MSLEIQSPYRLSQIDLKSLKGQTVLLLNNNDEKDKGYFAFGVEKELIIKQEAKDSFNKLRSFLDENKDWIFGSFSYDLKNSVENLYSLNIDHLDFPAMHFFIPQVLLEEENGVVRILKNTINYDISHLFKEDQSSQLKTSSVELKPRIGREVYIDSVEDIKEHIQLGDIYEMNFCQEYFCENTNIDSWNIYKKLNSNTLAPFSCYMQSGEKFLMCGSPERFMKKTGNLVISQPIKGTIKRGLSKEEDLGLKLELQNDEKEKSENVMITDLVRNDLSRTALKGSVRVDKLFEIKTFKTVHQMISTVSSRVPKDCHPVDIIEKAYPMGSMTGAPKIRAMKLIEKYESVKRGIYSGSVGYFTPDGDFDFNVVIRSLVYDARKKYLSAMVGGAITAGSDPEKEYHECLLKADALFKALQ